jgi:hypothetical protein
MELKIKRNDQTVLNQFKYTASIELDHGAPIHICASDKVRTVINMITDKLGDAVPIANGMHGSYVYGVLPNSALNRIESEFDKDEKLTELTVSLELRLNLKHGDKE